MKALAKNYSIEKGYFQGNPRRGRTTRLMLGGACVLEVVGLTSKAQMLRQYSGK